MTRLSLNTAGGVQKPESDIFLWRLTSAREIRRNENASISLLSLWDLCLHRHVAKTEDAADLTSKNQILTKKVRENLSHSSPKSATSINDANLTFLICNSVSPKTWVTGITFSQSNFVILNYSLSWFSRGLDSLPAITGFVELVLKLAQNCTSKLRRRRKTQVCLFGCEEREKKQQARPPASWPWFA